MASENSVSHAWDMMKSIGICMLATWNGQELRSRPMGAHVMRDENIVYFLTDVRNMKDDEIEQYPKINLAFSDSKGQKYVSVSGTAQVSNDRAKIKELFTTPAKAWWDSENDPNIRVLKFTPHDAEYWDSPGTIISYVKMAAAAATNTRPDLGENRKVAM